MTNTLLKANLQLKKQKLIKYFKKNEKKAKIKIHIMKIKKLQLNKKNIMNKYLRILNENCPTNLT